MYLFYAGMGGEGGGGKKVAVAACPVTAALWQIVQVHSLQASSFNMKDASKELKINLRHPKI
jgi:hypothetical protein